MQDDRVFESLKRGLKASSMKHDIVAENIANLSTPGYSSKALNFKAMMADKVSGNLPMAVTSGNHIVFNDENIIRNLFVYYPDNTKINDKGNNVDVDKEMVKMKENNTYYNALAAILKRKYGLHRTAISGRV